MAYIEVTDDMGRVTCSARCAIHQISSTIQDLMDEHKIRLGVGFTLSIREAS